MQMPSPRCFPLAQAALWLALLLSRVPPTQADVEIETSHPPPRPWMFSFAVTGVPTSFTDEMADKMATTGFGDDVPPSCVDILIIRICSSGESYPIEGDGEWESYFTSLAYTTRRGVLIKLGYESRQLGTVVGRNEDVGTLSLSGGSRNLAMIVGLEGSTAITRSARLYGRIGAGPVASWSRYEVGINRSPTSHSRLTAGTLAETGATAQLNRWLAFDLALQAWYVPAHRIPAIHVTRGDQTRTFPATEMTLSHMTAYLGIGTRW